MAASDLHQYSSFSDTYIQGSELRGINTANFAATATNNTAAVNSSTAAATFSTPSDTLTSAAAGSIMVAAANNTLTQQQAAQLQQQMPPTSEHGMIHTPVHSQFVVQRVGTLPRQFAHPLAQI